MYMFTLDEMSAFHCGFELYCIRAVIFQLYSTKALQSSLAEVQSLDLVLYNVSHCLILNKMYYDDYDY